MKKLLLFICLLPVCSFAYELDGAFGVKFNSKQNIVNGKYKDVSFTPDSGYEFLMFDNYSYSLTPKTGKVYSISATGGILNNCNKDLGVINKIIQDKYEVKSLKREVPIKYVVDNKNLNDSIVTYSFKVDKNRILLSCDPEYNKIFITYIDIDAVRLSYEETNKILNKEISKEIKKMKKDKVYQVKGL